MTDPGDLDRWARPRRAGPTPWQVLGPSVGAVAVLLLVALVARPGAFVVRAEVGGPAAVPSAAATAGTEVAGQAAPPREAPTSEPGSGPTAEPAVEALAALGDLLLGRDASVLSGDPAGWTASSPDPTDLDAPTGSFTVLRSLPVTRFESTVVEGSLRPVDDPAAGGDFQARVETLYGLAGVPPVVRTDTVVLDAPDGTDPGAAAPPAGAQSPWRVVSWTPEPSTGEVGTTAPWDLGEVVSVVGDRGVVLSWVDPAAVDDGSVPPAPVRDAQQWAGRAGAWVEEGAVVVDSYLGTGWPRSTLVLVPSTTGQYDALVPGPAPERPDVFAAVTTDVRTPEGTGDLVVLNPAARDGLVEETWQVTVTHELVHVASGARYGDGQEVWLAEGLADLVGWSTFVPATASREEVSGRLLARVAAGTADVAALPDRDDFSAADADTVGDAYEGAWLATLLLEDELGTDGVLAVYEDASDGPGSARQRTDSALRAATGEGRAAFEARWAAYLATLAAR